MIFETNVNEEAIFTKSHKNPVFIVLSSGSSLFAKGIKRVTNSEFSHAMISFNHKLDPLYSFGTKPDGKMGFVINNTKSKVWDIDDCKFSVYVMFVTDKAKANMKKALQYFIDRKDELKYDFPGIIDIWRNKTSDDHKDAWFCSRFVMELISKAQSLTKSASLWKPSDIMNLDNISIVNRGFNLYNYNPKVTARHVADIINGSYNVGDVIYESSGTYEKYIIDGNYDYLEDTYSVMYRENYYKIPETGYPCSNKEAKEIEEAAKKAAESYYKFKPSDANRGYPFKFFNVLNISKDKYMKLINGNIPLSKRAFANLYHVNIKDNKKKISIILVATKQQVYSTYLLINGGISENSTLLKFNYEGIMYQEQTVLESKNKTSTVYFTRNITPESLQRIYHAMNHPLLGKVGVKISTGEYGGHNFLQPDLIKNLVQEINGTILECNTAYKGSRNTSEAYWDTIKKHGFSNIADVDLMDEYGEIEIPVKNPYHIKKNIIGQSADQYNTILILSHFKGHTMAGYGGALKNMSIGMASSKGKINIHTAGKGGDMMKADRDAFLESMVDADRSIMDYYGWSNILYINVANNLSVDCDCIPHPHKPEIEDIGIFASTDPVAVDQACIDAVFRHPNPKRESLIRRINTRNGIHTIECAEKKGLGSRKYVLVDIDAVQESAVDDNIIDRQYNQDASTVNTAKFIQSMIKKEQLKGNLLNVSCTDIQSDKDGWSFADYKISNSGDGLKITDFIGIMNKMIETSPNYTGIIKEPKNIYDKDSSGSLVIYKDDKQQFSHDESTVDEKSLKFYVNPARQLKVKNTKKKHDQISKGNYSDLTSTVQSTDTSKNEKQKS